MNLHRTEQRSSQFSEIPIKMKGERYSEIYFMQPAETWKTRQENSKYICTLMWVLKAYISHKEFGIIYNSYKE